MARTAAAPVSVIPHRELAERAPARAEKRASVEAQIQHARLTAESLSFFVKEYDLRKVDPESPIVKALDELWLDVSCLAQQLVEIFEQSDLEVGVVQDWSTYTGGEG